MVMRRVGWVALALLIVGATWVARKAHGQFEAPPARDAVVGFDVTVQDHGEAFFSVLLQDAAGRLYVDVYGGDGVKTGHIPLVAVRPEPSTVQPVP